MDKYISKIKSQLTYKEISITNGIAEFCDKLVEPT